MPAKLHTLATYLNSRRPNFVNKTTLYQINVINRTGHLLAEDVLTTSTLITWAYSQKEPITIVTSSQYDKIFIQQLINTFPDLDTYNTVELMTSSEIIQIDASKVYFYANLYDIRIKPFDTYSGTAIISYYKKLDSLFNPEIYKKLVEEYHLKADAMSNIDLTDSALTYLEDTLDIKFEEHPYMYTYVLAYILSKYILRLNIDYEIVEGIVHLAGTCSKLQSIYTPLYQIATNFLYEKHHLINMPQIDITNKHSQPSIIAENIKGAYLNYSNKQEHLYLPTSNAKLMQAIQIATQTKKPYVVIVCDSETMQLGRLIQDKLAKMKKASNIVSTLLTFTDTKWCVIDITDSPNLLKSDYKLVDSTTLSNSIVSKQEMHRRYLSLVTNWNTRYKNTSDLNYINTNIVLQYRRLWYQKFGETEIFALHELENEYLLLAYNKFKKYRNINDYSNSMYKLMQELFTNVCSHIKSRKMTL